MGELFLPPGREGTTQQIQLLIQGEKALPALRTDARLPVEEHFLPARCPQQALPPSAWLQPRPTDRAHEGIRLRPRPGRRSTPLRHALEQPRTQPGEPPIQLDLDLPERRPWMLRPPVGRPTQHVLTLHRPGSLE
jgi:hypothetical protein